jgi:hypothetical protein
MASCLIDTPGLKETGPSCSRSSHFRSRPPRPLSPRPAPPFSPRPLPLGAGMPDPSPPPWDPRAQFRTSPCNRAGRHCARAGLYQVAAGSKCKVFFECLHFPFRPALLTIETIFSQGSGG